jgi:DNA-binding response OmpR family regulator
MVPEESAQPRTVILNVNDNEGARYMVTLMLKRAGFEVLEADCGEAALLKIEQRSPDLIVLDIDLPDISGFEVCRRIRASPPANPIKILHTSATFVALESKIQSLENGADGYLMQPFEPEELIATVRSLLRLNDAEQELIGNAERLREADRRKDEFLAMLAHELRNPLSAITASIPLMERRPPMDDVERRAREVLHRQAAHLGRLIDDLLDVARVTQGKIELQRELIELGGLLRRVAESAEQTKMRPREQTLLMALPEAPVFVRGDAARLEQIFTNLLDNASKYTDTGGSVRVALNVVAGPEGATAIVVVRDNGIGMAAKTLPTIFGLFAQGDVPIERSRGGLGIGLTLVQTLVQLHGGEVVARSDGLGKGSEFEVQLPALRDVGLLPGRVPGDGASKPLNGAMTSRKILIVEDSPDAQQMLKDLLEMWGHEVVCASDGVAGVSAALAASPDVALVDIGLPGLDGYEVARRIRRNPEGKDLMLVALTGYGSPEQKAKALEAGFNVHVAKPVNAKRLASILEESPAATRNGRASGR